MSKNNTLPTAIGLDKSVQRLQTHLFDFLSQRWSGDIDVFGRAYRNLDKKEDYVLEWFNGDKNDYEDVYYNDSSSDAVLFFIDSKSETTDDRVSYLADMKLVVMCDISKILPPTSSSKRRDEEAHRDLVEAIRDSGSTTIEGIEKDMDTIFSGISTKDIKFNNIHPKHCFAVLLKVNYYLTDKC